LMKYCVAFVSKYSNLMKTNEAVRNLGKYKNLICINNMVKHTFGQT